MLAGIAIDRFSLSHKSVDAEPYHLHVREAAVAVPYQFASWLGVDVPVPQGAINLLKPNVVISRRFEELGTGRRVSVLLVQCKDARDILGHFPPICYPGQGWTLISSTPRDWKIDGAPIHGTSYVFNPGTSGMGQRVVIDNFMLLPDGSTAPDMDAVEIAAQDARRKYFGAAQVQLVYDPSLSQQDREEMLGTFVKMLHPLMKTIAQEAVEVTP